MLVDRLNHTSKIFAYKDVNKRVKPLAHLKLVDEIKEHFESERGAKHYRITAYGLIIRLDKAIAYDHRYMIYNKENIVIRSLLLQFLEEETIVSISPSTEEQRLEL